MAVTGSIGLRDFDKGVQETLGAILVETENEGTKYFLQSKSLNEDVPVVMATHEAIFREYKLPSIVIKRGDPTLALNRYVGGYAYREPVGDGVEIDDIYGNIVGSTLYVSRPTSYPFDIVYDIQVLHKFQGLAIKLLDEVLRVYKPVSKVLVKDTERDERSYTVFVQGVAGVSEFLDVTGRVQGFIVTLKVEAEIDLCDELDPVKAVNVRPIVNVTKKV